MTVTEDRILAALREIPYPGFSRDVVSVGAVSEIRVHGGTVELRLSTGPGEGSAAEAIEREVRRILGGIAGVEGVVVRGGTRDAAASELPMAGSTAPSPARSGALDPGALPGTRHIVAVASGKGGVGKSTVAVNLAVALARRGHSVGLLDVDLYGPSVPLMIGMQGQRVGADPARQKIPPVERFGLRWMSLGFLVDPESAVIWRGPMVMKAIEQLVHDVDWGELDVLLLDMPPGTGDAQLTVSQRLSLTGAVVVTTPQDVALADVVKAVAMFRKVGVPVLGVVENMSFFECPQCAHRSEIFGHGGGRAKARELEVPFLAEVPLDGAIRAASDEGRPVVDAAPDSPRARAFFEVAERVEAALAPEPTADATRGGSIFDRFRKVWGR